MGCVLFFVLPISCCVLASPSALTVASSRPYPPPASSVWRNFPHQPASAASTRTKIRPSVNDKLIQKVMDIFIGCCKLFARGLGVAENALRFFVLFLTLSHSLSPYFHLVIALGKSRQGKTVTKAGRILSQGGGFGAEREIMTGTSHRQTQYRSKQSGSLGFGEDKFNLRQQKITSHATPVGVDRSVN